MDICISLNLYYIEFMYLLFFLNLCIYYFKLMYLIYVFILFELCLLYVFIQFVYEFMYF